MTSELTAIKEAGVDPGIHEVLRRRWSPRAFQERTVDRDTLLLLFEAARWAPSSANEQPWRFVVATRSDRAAYDRLLGCLTARNQMWAQLAPVLMITVARTKFSQADRANRHAMHDVGLATSNLMAQATALGLSVHAMAGFDVEKAREVLQVPEGFQPVAVVAIGYRGDPALLPEDFRAREGEPRTRKPLSEVLFSGTFGAAL